MLFLGGIYDADRCSHRSCREIVTNGRLQAQLGSISIAQRVINNFRQAGISKIVVVTGYNADALERHLASNHVIFLRNEDYETTHMFDSVRIGLEYLKDTCRCSTIHSTYRYTNAFSWTASCHSGL